MRDFKKGDRVFVAPKVPCMACFYCAHGHYPICSNIKTRLPGGFAEYILVPEALVERGTYLLPENMSFDQSTFIEPLACVVRAQNFAGVSEDSTVLILGCGMSGLLHVKLARARGARIIATDRNPARLEFARGMGAGLALDASEDVPARVMAACGKPADIVIVCTGAKAAIEQAWKSLDKGGTIVFFAVPGPGEDVALPLNDLWTKEVRILTSYYCGPPDIKEAMDLMATGTVAVNDLITHRLPLAEIIRGFQLVMDGRESIKVVIRPHEGPGA